MLDKKLCLTSVVEFLRRGRVDRGTREGKVVVVIDLSKQKVECRYHTNHGFFSVCQRNALRSLYAPKALRIIMMSKNTVYSVPTPKATAGQLIITPCH